jgi:hypothetical protein
MRSTEEALAKASAGEQEGIDTVATFLGVEMLDEAIAFCLCNHTLTQNSFN